MKNISTNNKDELYTCSKKKDDLNTLLERVDYANNYDSKININSWLSLISFIATLFVCLFVYNNFTSHNFFTIFLVIFIIFRQYHNYYQHHIINMIHYNTDNNIKKIRKKLNLKRVKKIKIGSYEKDTDRFHYSYKNFNYDS